MDKKGSGRKNIKNSNTKAVKCGIIETAEYECYRGENNKVTDNKIEILDSTLRDGVQAEGITFSVDDKLRIIKILDNLEIDYIEAGNPFSNPKEKEFFQRLKDIRLEHSRLVAFGSTRRKNIKAWEDENLNSILKTSAKYSSVFGKTWDLHTDKILKTTKAENLAMIEESCRYLSDNGVKVFFDAEHFFDGYKSNKGFALDCLKAAVKGGCELLVLCDTNGGCMPLEITDIIKEVQKEIKGVKLGVHIHNDSDVACAASIMSAQIGVRHIQGTLLGFGERCGNARLSSVIPNLQLKLGCDCIPENKLSLITKSSRQIAEISNIQIKRSSAYIGGSAFSHKAGMHIDAVSKIPYSFEHISPSSVGNRRHFLMSEISGKTAMIKKIEKINPQIKKSPAEIENMLKSLKLLERDGYQFEGADASFEIFIRKHLGKYKSFFKILNYKVIADSYYNTDLTMSAMVKVKVGEKQKITAAEGNGPINALDLALKDALMDFFPALSDMHLIDYKVRVIDTVLGTASHVRVIISSSDHKHIWNTVGVSANVIDASFKALVDSVKYKLIKDFENNGRKNICDIPF